MDACTETNSQALLGPLITEIACVEDLIQALYLEPGTKEMVWVCKACNVEPGKPGKGLKAEGRNARLHLKERHESLLLQLGSPSQGSCSP